MSKSTISTFQLFEMFPTAESARIYLESRLWLDGPFCPECKSRERVGKQPKVAGSQPKVRRTDNVTRMERNETGNGHGRRDGHELRHRRRSGPMVALRLVRDRRTGDAGRRNVGRGGGAGGGNVQLKENSDNAKYDGPRASNEDSRLDRLRRGVRGILGGGSGAGVGVVEVVTRILVTLVVLCTISHAQAPDRALKYAGVALIALDAGITQSSLSHGAREVNAAARPFVTHGTPLRMAYFGSGATAFWLGDRMLRRRGHGRWARIVDIGVIASESWMIGYSLRHRGMH